MKIPPLPLPSRANTKVIFRAPTVDDAMYFCKATAETEERDTTEYLNLLQDDKDRLDSRNWTAQDRRTALWWIFINSRSDTVIDYSYTCQHCGEEHWVNQDMYDLFDELDVLESQENVAVSIPVQGKPHDWLIKPLDGNAMERLERMRQLLPPQSKAEAYKAAIADLRKWEFTYQAHLFYDLEPDYDTSAQRRYDLIGQMDYGTELMQLAANMRIAQEKLSHGLNVQVDKGESLLVLPPHSCQSEALQEPAERPITRLLVPFRNTQFLPDVGAGPFANLSVQPGLVWRSTN
ncbi:morphogenetic protein [Enterobacter soli]|uniref:morphogenetic protein n=1 Tax=Enterobacter soli TaxID=885040 RepID=UPI002F3F9674